MTKTLVENDNLSQKSFMFSVTITRKSYKMKEMSIGAKSCFRFGFLF